MEYITEIGPNTTIWVKFTKSGAQWLKENCPNDYLPRTQAIEAGLHVPFLFWTIAEIIGKRGGQMKNLVEIPLLIDSRETNSREVVGMMVEWRRDDGHAE